MNLRLYLEPMSLVLAPATAAWLLGCTPTTPGDDTDGSGSAESGADTESTGGTSQGQTSGQTSGTDPTGSETEQLPCPPIDIPACTVCECIDGEWACDDSACFACEELACGDSCLRCPDEEPNCGIPALEGVCTALGECVGVPPPKLGFCEGALQPGFESELVASGCADVVIEAHDGADERGLVVQLSQELALAQTAIDTGNPQHVELSATDPSVTIEGRAGFFVTAAECNDVVVPEIDINENWLPVAGMVIVDVVPDGAGQALATVQLVDVELHRLQPGPGPLVVNATWSDVSVGWFPG